MKNIKMKLSCGLLSVAMMAPCLSLDKAHTAYAESKINPGQIIETPFEREEADEETRMYYKYVIEKGDDLCLISKKVCSFFSEEPSMKFWPVLAYLNDVKKYIYEGRELIFPDSYERLEELLAELKENGWTDNYINTYDVYKEYPNEDVKKEKKTSNNTNRLTYPPHYCMTVREVMQINYGGVTTVNDDFINLVIQALGLEGRYTADSLLKNNDEVFLFVDWIPSLEQLEEFKTSKNNAEVKGHNK